MRLGFSILLGEHINSAAISYDDCRAFQIVCPACREPVFKVVRDSAIPPLHYLSHYAADEAYAADCELRVNRMAEAEIQKENALGRGQRLKLFLQVLRDTIVRSQYSEETRSDAEQFARSIRESAGFRSWRESMFDHAYETFRSLTPEQADELLEGYVKDITAMGATFPRTAFSLQVQKRIAWDVWKHVLTPAARGNYAFLLSHAVVQFVARLRAAEQARNLFLWERVIAESVFRLVHASLKESEAVYERLLSTPVNPPHSLESTDAFTKMSAEVTHEAIGVLLRLPYFEILKESRREVSTAS